MTDKLNEINDLRAERDARIGEIEARVEAATPGPWFEGRTPVPTVWAKQGVGPKRVIAVPQAEWGEGEQSSCDAAFMAHSRDDIPYLLDSLAAAIARWDAEHERAESGWSVVDGLYVWLDEQRARGDALEARKNEWHDRFVTVSAELSALTARVAEAAELVRLVLDPHHASPSGNHLDELRAILALLASPETSEK